MPGQIRPLDGTLLVFEEPVLEPLVLQRNPWDPLVNGQALPGPTLPSMLAMLAGGASHSPQSIEALAVKAEAPILTERPNSTMPTFTSPGVWAAFCSTVRSWCEALCKALILVPLASPWPIEPELSNTSATHNLV